MRAAGVAATCVAVATVFAGCGNSATGDHAGSTSSGGGIARAKAEVTKFAANPALTVSPLPSPPKSSTYAIQVTCIIPACAPGAMDPGMAALGWRFEKMPYDISKGPSAVQQALTQAIAAKPDVILVTPGFPDAMFKSQIDSATKAGIKVIGIGGTNQPGYSACIACATALGAVGTLAADVVLADAGGKTDIALTVDPTIASNVSEADGVKREVAKNGEGSRVLVVQQSVGATPAENAARVVSFLQRNPNVKYVLTSAKFQAATALNSAGLGSRVKTVGYLPLSDSDVAAVKSGQILAYAAGELQALYWRAVDAAARVMEGAEVAPEPLGAMRVIDRSNADDALLEPADYEDIYKAAWHK